MDNLTILNSKRESLSLNDVMRSVYFDIPDSQMNYPTYSTKAYFDELGWYLIDANGNKQYEDLQYLKFSEHKA
jgi:hypothetical protein